DSAPGVVPARPTPASLNGTRRTALILTQSEQLQLGGQPITTPVTGDTIDLAGGPPPAAAPPARPGRAPRACWPAPARSAWRPAPPAYRCATEHSGSRSCGPGAVPACSTRA